MKVRAPYFADLLEGCKVWRPDLHGSVFLSHAQSVGHRYRTAQGRPPEHGVPELALHAARLCSRPEVVAYLRRGVAHTSRFVCDVCDEGFQARGHSIAGGRTHATKRHVCATPTATEYQGWRIHRGFCDACDEGLQARAFYNRGRTHATKRHVCVSCLS